ncbi:MAG TPA: NUDIX hydrolase [Azonexus sp.]
MISYCTRCGSGVSFIVPAGDSLPRHVCNVCGHIHYENPRLVIGCVAEYDGRILLCRRAIEPRRGFWTLPAGFMENGESTAAAASRETHEEAGARIIIDAPFAMVSIAHINQVHLFYRGRLATPDYSAGEESLEVALFAPHEIPWTELSFRSVSLCLEKYLDDRKRGHYAFHDAELAPSAPLALSQGG